jgi:hypothetical protein
VEHVSLREREHVIEKDRDMLLKDGEDDGDIVNVNESERLAVEYV